MLHSLYDYLSSGTHGGNGKEHNNKLFLVKYRVSYKSVAEADEATSTFF